MSTHLAVSTNGNAGDVSVMVLKNDEPKPTLGGEFDVLVNCKATSVNRLDTLQRQGKAPVPPGASTTLGVEGAGIVSEVGAKVTKWKVGDRVMCLLKGGGYAEYFTVNEGSCIPVPESMSWTDAAAIPEVFLTAFQSLRVNGNVKKGDTVLIHAGASGVGTAACQLVKLFGATSVTTSSAGKIDFVKQFADHAVDREADKDGKKFAPKVIEVLGGSKVNHIIDPVFGGGYIEENAEVMAADGKVVVLAFMGGSAIENFNAIPFFRKRAEIKFSTLRSQSDAYKAALVDAFIKEGCLEAFQNGTIKPVVEKALPISEVQDAHRDVENNATSGKVVLSFELEAEKKN